MGSERGAILERMIMEGSSAEVTFEQRPDGKEIRAGLTASAKALT